MRINGNIFTIMAIYFLIVTGAYAVWSFIDTGTVEIIGTAAIGMLVLMSVFIAFYLYKSDKVQGPVPEDRLDALIEDGEAEVGFFSPWSWWPFALGAGSAIAFASLAVGWWLFFIALPIGLVALVGFVFEYSRGQHAH